jgi:ubiquinone/menaquinone biosynthesis C-methylase UbiE
LSLPVASQERSPNENHRPGRSEWDRRVDRWDQVAATPAFARLAAAVRRFAAARLEDEVVDLGSGTGLLTLTLAPAVARIRAVDSSAAMLERLAMKAERLGFGNVEPVLADLRALPLADESATLVVSNYAFHHLDDAGKELALSEARRILVPGGRLVVCDMMFSLSLERRDRALVAEKLALLARRGPAGFLRIARNVARLAVGRWERPSPLGAWERMLAARHFESIAVLPLEHEAGIALARRPLGRGA